MSKDKRSSTREAPASSPASILNHDRSVALRQKRALRPPAVEESTHYPLILLVEDREAVRVALKGVLETSRCDVVVVDHALDAMTIAATYEGQIDFLITKITPPGINGGLLSHLFRRTHPETRTLFVSGSREQVLICDTSNLNISVLEQPVAVEVVAGTIGEMIANALDDAESK